MRWQSVIVCLCAFQASPAFCNETSSDTSQLFRWALHQQVDPELAFLFVHFDVEYDGMQIGCGAGAPSVEIWREGYFQNKPKGGVERMTIAAAGHTFSADAEYQDKTEPGSQTMRALFTNGDALLTALQQSSDFVLKSEVHEETISLDGADVVGLRTRCSEIWNGDDGEARK